MYEHCAVLRCERLVDEGVAHVEVTEQIRSWVILDMYQQLLILVEFFVFAIVELLGLTVSG